MIYYSKCIYSGKLNHARCLSPKESTTECDVFIIKVAKYKQSISITSL
jgi:hypothetical protein